MLTVWFMICYCLHYETLEAMADGQHTAALLRKYLLHIRAIKQGSV